MSSFREAVGSYTAGTCSCLAALLLVFAVSSPVALLGVSFDPVNPNLYQSYSSGPYVAAAYYSNLPSSARFLIGRWVYWSELPGYFPCSNTTSEIYEKWAYPNGICVPASDGSMVFRQPSQVGGLLATGLLGSIFAGLSTVLTCASIDPYSNLLVVLSLVTCFFASVFTLANFLIWVNWDLSQSMRSPQGSYIPAWGNDGQLKAVSVGPMNYGPGFNSVIAAYVFLMIALFFLGTDLHLSRKRHSDDGSYGIAPPHNQ